MIVGVTRIYRFEAAHRLPSWAGPAGRIHGHSYTVEVTTAPGMPTEELDLLWESIHHRCDHRLLNDEWEDTTVEGLAEAMLLLLPDALVVSVQEGQERRGTAQR